MCGIFGAVSLRHAPLKYPDCVGAMAAALAHRGPDGEQIVGHERARLGARRLAIMDLTTGDQPFQNPDGAIWMICNGEIYNAPELRREDRKSTRLNSSHGYISYAVFCLKKKKKQKSQDIMSYIVTNRISINDY